ncbi:pyroglutamyl-peptidase I Cysteine peptidase. MEROPS family C15 [Rhizobiales bacterium GAS191]|jgi:pyroglutamyl-peptidase|nr:pyroglutamyl-peptidase I Cysteine peptidase. MEROPS family C15 [Rhizobiales bacterium GAS113]SEC33119.1 pyroglutamyl-peptidase I Cysteine peptidase. MEROPS family C15 [Rhizobiales bacterium GAS191]SEC92352.1 pyroglutamyl-peptidase I Cysteine peptidase. MEROPS family C15 [Rhizobiales bacterium GAS188]
MARIVLLTGFEPFGGETENPSWDAVRGLDEERVDGHRLAARLMPCVFGEALIRLEAEIAALRPSVVLCVGQAGGRAEISVERVAINLDDARIPDNKGAQPLDRPAVAGGPAAYFSSLPVKAIVRDLLAANIPAGLSQTAGTFVCNHIFYGACHMRAKSRREMRAGFIHIPYSPAQAARHPGSPSLAVPIVTEALRIAVATSLRSKVDAREIGGAIS